VTTLLRASAPCALREGAQGEGRTLFGHFAVTNQWTEIDSWIEGRFMERFATGSLLRTMAEDRHRMRVLFQHGRDPSVGDKVLGPLQTLREDERGGFYEVPLFHTTYNAELLPGLRAGVYGASFRFRVVREEWAESPDHSEWNPLGLPERTVKEARVAELGPVTFPAYEGATAGVRSLTDWYHGTERTAA
jgi:HK97 family phage prohead protease